jgi:hypothetical protein
MGLMARAIYAAYFTSFAGQSIGIFYIGDGILTGVDVGTMRYDGVYKTLPDGSMEGEVEYVIPTGVSLITGAPPATTPTKMSLKLTLPFEFDDGRIITIQTPAGPINARFEKLKELP